MKNWTIKYLSYADRVVTTTVETDDFSNETDAIDKAYLEQNGPYSNDNIFEIIDVTED